MSKRKSKKASLPVKLLRFLFAKKFKKNKKHQKRCGPGCKLLKVFGKLFGVLAGLYAILFAVFFFDLDGKLLYYVVEPALAKHYDKMERKNPLDMPYEMKS